MKYTSLKGILFALALATMLVPYSFAQVEGISIISAENYYRDKDYRNALIGFEEYLEDVEFNKEVSYKAGICATRLGIGKKAIQYILNARSGGKKDNYMDFWLGRAFHLNEQWDSAGKYLELYLDVFPIDKSFKKDTEIYLKQIDLARSMAPTTLQPYCIENMGSGINSVYSEFHPMLTADKKVLVYTSRKRGFMEEKLLDDGEYKEKIFQSHILPDGTWSKGIPLRLVEGRNRDLDYNAIQLFDNDTKLLLFRIANNEAKLYVAEYANENWKLPYQIPIEPDPTFFTGDVIFTNDLKTVIFTTNGTTNDFQSDLYTSTYDDKTEKWSTPVFLGKNIDSRNDEAAPFLLDNNTLIFSSKSENGLGGYDLFKTTFDEKTKTWGNPENYGFPYNTPNNDFYFFVQKDNPNVQFISSTRGTTKGLSDIYKISKTAIVEVNGQIKDEAGNPVASAEVEFDDLENYQNLKIKTDTEGRFSGKLVAGQTYVIQFMKGNTLTEAFLPISFPVVQAELSNIQIQLKPKKVLRSQTESGATGTE